jgi:hypothetical protein
VADEAKEPEHDQNNNYSPEHGVPFDLLNWPTPQHFNLSFQHFSFQRFPLTTPISISKEFN